MNSEGKGANEAEISVKNTFGKDTRLSINMKEQKKVEFTEQQLDNYQANTTTSGNGMIKLSNFLRSTAGRNSVPKFYKNHVSKKAKSLEELYNVEIFDFDTDKKGDVQSKRSVVYADAEELLESVLERRNVLGNNFFN